VQDGKSGFNVVDQRALFIKNLSSFVANQDTRTIDDLLAQAKVILTQV